MALVKKTGVLLAAALLAAASGCSTRAPDSGSNTDSGTDSSAVKTDLGVKDKEITLGVLTDLTGVFAAVLQE